MEGLDLIGFDVVDVFADAADGLSEEVILEAAVVQSLHNDGLGALGAGGLPVHGLLFGFNLLLVELTVSQQIVKKGHSLLHLIVGEG